MGIVVNEFVDALKDGKSAVELVAYTRLINPDFDDLDGDLLTVNAARASFGKEHVMFEHGKDDRLLNFLSREKHLIPFAHTHCTLRFRAPIFVARQLVKHQVGFSWSEESMRYISPTGDYFIPQELRKAAENVKQGSSEEVIDNTDDLTRSMAEHTQQSLKFYDYLVNQGVCKEQARMILPLNLYVTWVWTGSLLGWARMYGLRIDAHAQKETQAYAKAVGLIMSELYPYSWESLTKGIENVA